MADFSPDAPEFYQRTHRVRLKNSGTSDKKSSHKIKYKELLASHIRNCVARDIRGGKDETIDELVATLQKLMK